ncbi:murein biosynthesis integral membrane protein MurJ [Corynebacterium cystitidis]|uniref:murein biosynthesis integral membrane protein MurJ n=1 Tax=Corynebacterium cystitidis TaxID=35757 RepID=UPI00211F3466|nr:murein biosynthesis integral membrane protein MurJ [Corynebacterium cystitidis]
MVSTENTAGNTAGQRGRIVTPSPPAPVPVPRPTKEPDPQPAQDLSGLTASPADGGAGASASAASDVGAGATTAKKANNEDVVRSTGSMAIATLLSRVTGFIRTVMITSMLGGAIASAFNLANTLPNMITEIVLGSVMTALVVPVLVRAEKEDADGGAGFIRQLFTLTLTLMLSVTVIATVAAPLLVSMMMDEEAKTNIVQSTSFAYLLLPQIFFYGLFSLFQAVLNTKGVFKPGAWAPVVNNLISITVLAAYRLVPGSLNPAAPSPVTDPHILLLGLGTTLGVVVQCAILLPYLKKLNIDLRLKWGIDDRLKAFGGMAVAIVAYVAVSQLGYVITARIATEADASAYAIYQQHWQLLQVPYGIIGVALLTAIMPRLSRNAADGDDRAVVRDLTLATKLTFIALIPIVIFMMAFGPDIGNALFGYGAFETEEARTLGMTISFSAFTLIPYALVMLHLRVFYAREEAWTPTFIIAGITATKVLLSYVAPLVASSSEFVVVLLGAANGFGFVAGAVIGAFLLTRKLGDLQSATILRTSTWAAAAGIIGAAAALLTQFLIRQVPFNPVALLLRLGQRASIGLVVELGIVGVVFLIVAGLVLSRSGLPEVQNLGRLFTRLPVVGKFINPDEQKAIETGQTDPKAMSQQFLAADSFNASPVPPPMSAGVVRGPRLVAGAPVSDGRFRLLRDHGSVSGARFWQAREISTEREVALVFVDTHNQAPLAAVGADEAARRSREVARRTRQLRALEHPAIAPNIQVLSYRSGCLIVADWVPGASVKSVVAAEGNLHPQAVAGAMAPLADALADCHDQGNPMGLDNRNRLRVSTDGHVVLAFPAVLPDASDEKDMSALASALELLNAGTGDAADSRLTAITKKTRALADDAADPDTENPTSEMFHNIADELREFSGVTVHSDDDVVALQHSAGDHGDTENTVDAADTVDTEALQVVDEDTPEPERLSGFGSRGYSVQGFVAVIAAAIAVVVLIAALTTYVVSVIGGDDPATPVNHQSVDDAATGTSIRTAENRPLPVIVEPSHVRVWQAPGHDPAADNPDSINNVIDGDTQTSWSSDSYPNGLGTKPGVGIVVTATEPLALQHLLIDTETPGAHYNLYGLPADQETSTENTALEDLKLLKKGTLRTNRNSLEIQDNPRVHGVVVWITDIPVDEDSNVEINEISMIGLPL